MHIRCCPRTSAHTLCSDRFAQRTDGQYANATQLSTSKSEFIADQWYVLDSLGANTTTGILNVDFGNEKINGIDIIDVMGKCAIKKSLAGISSVYQLDVSDLPPGIYFALERSASGQQFTARFLKK